MLIDMHAHTSGISTCCRIPAPEVIRAALDAGLDGIVLTNHYQRSYVKDGDAAAFAKRYTDEYEYTKKCGDELGCRVIYGMEVTMEKHGGAHILVYGLDPEFTVENPTLYDMTMEELYTLVKSRGGMLVQAHPFRRGRNMLQDLAYLDGVEANSHPLYDATHVEKLTKIAQEGGKILTSGGDYHADTPRPHCGAYLPDEIADTKQLADFLMNTDTIDIEYQEPGESVSHRTTYVRNPG
ncbi:MAG: PHP domain-containing protein [Clostridia bacterium]|nr:PHP domain-containing protein [Clostridia bacterium]